MIKNNQPSHDLTKHDKRSEKIDIKTASQQLMAAAALAGQIASTRPNLPENSGQVLAAKAEKNDPFQVAISQEEHQEIISKMVSFSHMPAGHLAKEDELYLEQQLTDMLGFEVTAELENNRLNHTVGLMGGEQHLYRFPGDDLSKHDAYLEAGIAPNRGAFGWFTENGQLTDKAIQNEKYYFAVQLMYLQDWNENHPQLKPWYKFRKMIMINPSEEVAVVGVVGDAGPAMWVKKQFGGSPEVIREGKVWSPKTDGHIILFFVDDPNDEIPLGPIDISWQEKIEESI